MEFGDKFERGIALILEAVQEAQSPTVANPELASATMRAELDEIARFRGRPAFFPYLGSGVGRGARAMLADGRWVLDFALGIGVHFFGHGDLDLIETAVRGAGGGGVVGGGVGLGGGYHRLMRTLLSHAPDGMSQC